MKATFAALVMMLFLTLGFSHAQANPPARLGIISDVDDTVRPTGVLHPARGILVAIGRKKPKAFAGMAKLYEQLLLKAGASPTKDEYFVSGSPWSFSFPVDNFLREHGFYDGNLFIRHGGVLRHTAEFKTGKFEKLLRENPRTSFIFIGDDGEKDAQAISDVSSRYLKQMVGKYIHSIEGKGPAIREKGQVAYFTALDIAIHELRAERLSDEQVDLIAQTILDDDQFQWNVIPVYAKLCPEARWLTSLIAELGVTLPERTLVKVGQIQTRVAAICTPDRVPRDFETQAEEVEALQFLKN